MVPQDKDMRGSQTLKIGHFSFFFFIANNLFFGSCSKDEVNYGGLILFSGENVDINPVDVATWSQTL